MLDPDALDRLRRFADEIDRRCPDTLVGVYAVGSLALGDYRSSTSNLDALAVADRPWSPQALASARPAVDVLGRGLRPAAVAWIDWDDLAAEPSTVGPPCTVGSSAVDSDRLVNPLTWQIVRTSAICTRGPEYPEIGVGELRSWARDQLLDREPALVARWRQPGRLWLRARAAGAVLDAARLWAAVGSGRVLSKAESVDALVEGASPPHQRVLRDSAGWRAGAATSMYWGPLERKRDAIGWLASTIEAAAHAGSGPAGP